MPACAIEQQNGVRALGDVAGYFFQMQLHGESVGVRQCERGAFAARRADCAEQIGAFIALVGGLARP